MLPVLNCSPLRPTLFHHGTAITLDASFVRMLSTAPDVLPLNWRGQPPKPGHMPRAEAIKEEHIGSTFLVHSGKDYKRVKVTAQMVMHKFGEFVPTRKRRPAPKKETGRGGKGQKKR